VTSSGRPRDIGSLAIVLHSHMPYVEGFGTYPFGEEWLFDAYVRSHLPVLEVADRVTVSVTPVLADQLEAAGVRERLAAFVEEYRVASCEADALDLDGALARSCTAEAGRYRRALARIDELGGDLLAAFREPAETGRVELVASAATHAVLPLVATDAGRALQVDAGLRSHDRRFGKSSGLWLPECAYEPGLDELLARHGIRWFCTDQSAHEPGLAALAPVATASGPTALTIDWEAIAWLWSIEGYPSAPVYADFHRESLRGARPWAIGGGAYLPEAAAAVAREQAASFVASAAERLVRFREERGTHGLLTFAIDTELLGHWWWEGPTWLAEVLRLAPERGLELVTASEAIERHEPEERRLHRTTWGEGKDLQTWDAPAVADMAWAARRLELRTLRAVGAGLDEACAERAVRELLALQASDWAFLDSRKQAGDYPWQRSTDHAKALLQAIDCSAPIDSRLRNLAPDLSFTPLLRP
jgi:1,4-alpha-glucan branching enzyme